MNAKVPLEPDLPSYTLTGNSAGSPAVENFRLTFRIKVLTRSSDLAMIVISGNYNR